MMLLLLFNLPGGESTSLAAPAPPAATQPAKPEPPVLDLGSAVSSSLTAADDGSTIIWSWKNGMRFQTEDGSVKGKLGGRLHWDASWLSLDDSLGLDDADGTEFRRARIATELEVDGFFAKAEYDFAGQDVDFNDVWIGRHDVLGTGDVKAGHMKEPFSLDYQTSANNITFLERSLMESLTLGRNTGVMAYDAIGGAANWAIGVFKDADDAGTNQMDGNYAVTARISGSPVYAEDGAEVLHLGAAYSVRDSSALRFRQRPEIHLAPYVLDTGDLAAEDVSYANIEVAGVLGSAHLQAEYTTVSASGSSGSPDFDGSGWYGQIGWFLTGETRPYKRDAGTFDRVVPQSPYGTDGYGALEIALRYSSVDLTDGAVVGGEQDNITLGVNWYLTPNLRVSADYVNGSADLGSGLDNESVSALLTRVQIDW